MSVKSSFAAQEASIGNMTNLFCVHLSLSADLSKVSEKLVDISDGNLKVTNKYFSALAEVKLLKRSTDIAGNEVAAMKNCSAIMLVVGSDSDVGNSKSSWALLSQHVGMHATRLFVLDFPFSSAEQLQDIRLWGAENNIEIVHSEICSEDGLSVADRIRDALNCTNWIHRNLTKEETHNQPEGKLRPSLNDDDIAKITDMLLVLDELSDHDDTYEKTE